MKRWVFALLMLAVGVCPAAEVSSSRIGDFIRGLAEREPEKRAAMLLSVGENEGYPGDLALIYLVGGSVPESLSTRLAVLAEKRSGELIPALLLLRNHAGDPDSAWRLGRLAWKAAANSRLSDFERQLFRELSGKLLMLGAERSEYSSLRGEVEALVSAHPDDWRQLIPLPELLDFYRACAFINEGYELPSEAWLDSALPARRAYARLRLESAEYIPVSIDEAERLVRHYMSLGERGEALEVAVRNFVRDKSKEGVSLLFSTGVEVGHVALINDFKARLNPKRIPSVMFDTLLRGGSPDEAEKLLPQIVDPGEAAAAEYMLLEFKGNFRALGELAMKRDVPVSGDRRMFALLLAAEYLKDGRYFAEAERSFGADAERDPSVANALGYVALVSGGDVVQAERRIRFALSKKPYEGAYWDSLAWAHYLRGDFSGAWNNMETALKYMPPVPESCEMLEHAGEIQLARGDRKRAEEFFHKAWLLAKSGSSSFPRGALFRAAVERLRGKLGAEDKK